MPIAGFVAAAVMLPQLSTTALVLGMALVAVGAVAFDVLRPRQEAARA